MGLWRDQRIAKSPGWVGSARCGAGAPGRSGRRGVVVLEFILCAPIMVILLFALVELALILTNLQQVKAASQAGAKVASELSTADLSSTNPADNINKVDTAVSTVLTSAGMTKCQVIFEYNPACAAFPPGPLTAGVPCTPACTAPLAPLPTLLEIPGGSVRVTVCVPINQLTPNLLVGFGFSISNRTAKESTTLPYENCPLNAP